MDLLHEEGLLEDVCLRFGGGGGVEGRIFRTHAFNARCHLCAALEGRPTAGRVV